MENRRERRDMVIMYVDGENCPVEEVMKFFDIDEKYTERARAILDGMVEDMETQEPEDETFFDPYIDDLDELREDRAAYGRLIEETMCEFIANDYPYETFLPDFIDRGFQSDKEWPKHAAKLSEEYYYSHLKKVQPQQDYMGLGRDIKANFSKYAKYFL